MAIRPHCIEAPCSYQDPLPYLERVNDSWRCPFCNTVYGEGLIETLFSEAPEANTKPQEPPSDPKGHTDATQTQKQPRIDLHLSVTKDEYQELIAAVDTRWSNYNLLQYSSKVRGEDPAIRERYLRYLQRLDSLSRQIKQQHYWNHSPE